MPDWMWPLLFAPFPLALAYREIKYPTKNQEP